MKMLRNEKGAITIIVLVSVLFMVSFLISSYVIIANKVQAQKEVIAETKRIYESDKSMEEIYNSYFNENGIIPIYTKEQYLEIGKNKIFKINDKYYTFSTIGTYILINGFEFDESELPIGWKEPENLLKNTPGAVDYNGYKVKVSYENGKEKIYDGRFTLDVADGQIDITSTGYKITYTDPETGAKTITEENYTGPYIITGTTTTNYVEIKSTGNFDITLKDLSIDASSISSYCAFNANYNNYAKRSKCNN